jgi:hypothetical protein
MLRLVAGDSVPRAAAEFLEGALPGGRNSAGETVYVYGGYHSSASLERRPQPPAAGTEPNAPAVPKPARKRRQLVMACIVALRAAGGWYRWQSN